MLNPYATRYPLYAMKVALVHEFLNQLGGAERVLENLLQIWPESKLHLLLYDRQKTGGLFDATEMRLSFLNAMPLAHRLHRWYLPLMPFAIERFSFRDFDVVFSDSSSFAKGVKAKGKLHICYCHTPTRFLWTEAEKYVDSQPYSKLVRAGAKAMLPWLRRWDYKAAQRPDYFIANSVNVQERIRRYYGRESVVIHPPVDTEIFHPEGRKENYYFVASRLEPYKKIELVIEAFNTLGLPLKVAGSGTAIERLRAMAKPNVEFLGRVSDEELRRRYSEALAYIFPAEEDAGIMVLEAQACGTPVIAYGRGGALETVVEGVTGEFFGEQTSSSLLELLKRFDPAKYDPVRIRENALKHDKAIFQRRIKEFVSEKYEEYRSSGAKPPR